MTAAGFVSAAALLPLAAVAWLALAVHGDTGYHATASRITVAAAVVWGVILAGGLALVVAGHLLGSDHRRRTDH